MFCKSMFAVLPVVIILLGNSTSYASESQDNNKGLDNKRFKRNTNLAQININGQSYVVQGLDKNGYNLQINVANGKTQINHGGNIKIFHNDGQLINEDNNNGKRVKGQILANNGQMNINANGGTTSGQILVNANGQGAIYIGNHPLDQVKMSLDANNDNTQTNVKKAKFWQISSFNPSSYNIIQIPGQQMILNNNRYGDKNHVYIKSQINQGNVANAFVSHTGNGYYNLNIRNNGISVNVRS